MSDEACVFIDTNVLVYLLSDDASKAARAEALLGKAGVKRCISTQVLSEFANAASRKCGLAWPEVGDFHDIFRDACEVRPIGDDDIETALAIAESLRFAWYDSLIVASAINAGATRLLTEDMHDLQRIGSMTVENPFR